MFISNDSKDVLHDEMVRYLVHQPKTACASAV